MELLILIRGTLVNDKEKQIEVVVHRGKLDQSSPVFVQNGNKQYGIDGTISSLDAIFRQEVAKRPGFRVKKRIDVVTNI
jgi:hypothetical protein